jgi:hypothetical protein
VVIAAGFVVAVPSVAGGQEPPGDESSTTTTEAVATTTTTEAPPEPEPECEPSYVPDLCIQRGLPDIDCDVFNPEFQPFPVLPPDPHGFDGDHDGIGCESGDEAPPPTPPAAPAAPVTAEPDFAG